MKRYLFAGVAMLALAACSKENPSTGGGEEEINPPVQSELSKASYTMGGGDSSRVFNFAYTGSAPKTKGISNFEMPAYPTIPADAVDVTGYSENDLREAGSIIKITGKHSNKINSWNSQTLYLAPGADVTCAIEGNITVYIMEGASLTFDAGSLSSIAGLYNWGTFTSASGDFNLNSNPFYSAADVTFNGTLTIPSNAQYYCEGTTTVKKVSINGNAKVESCAFIVGNEYEDNYGGSIDQWGNVQWNDNNGILVFDGGNVEFCTSWIKAGYIKFNSNNNLHLTLENNGKVETKYLQVDPKQNDQKFVTLGSTAVVCASYIYLNQTFQQNEDKTLPNFGAGVHLQDVVAIRENGADNDPSEYDIPTDGGINNPNFSMKGERCSPGYGEPENPTVAVPSLELITFVKSVDHDHDSDKEETNRHLSASSLTFDGNGTIYASYHMRGGNWGNDTYDKDDIEGCIERWTFNGESVELGNWMWTDDFEFNQVIIDQDNIITVGHKGGEKEVADNSGKNYTDYGGIIGKLPKGVWGQNWNAGDELTRDDFQYKYLTTEVPLMGDFENESGNVTNQKIDYQSAGDGNCVVKVDDRYFVATSAGYGVIDADFKRIKDEDGNVLFCSTDGSAKYLAVDNGQAYVLYLNDRAANGSSKTDAFGATLASMSVSAFPTAGTTTAMQNNVTPVDGKNVLVVDNGVVYACLSKGGLQVGNEVITFGEERSVNGVAVDDDYIYVANGSYVSVLDKNTKQLVTERKGNTKNVSANFVEAKEYNGEKYIFAAFGQEGIKVFKFVEAE